ncbi:MAG: hypothetical protein ABW000_21785 [Actinoplanes sp.]
MAWPLGHEVAGVPAWSTRIEPGTVARAALALGGTETGRADPAELPGAETEPAELPGAETEPAELPGAETELAELPGAETDQSEPPGAEAESAGAEPCTDARPLPGPLTEAEPKGAGLPGGPEAAEAPVDGAGLTGAEPREAGAESFEAQRAPGAGGGGGS